MTATDQAVQDLLDSAPKTYDLDKFKPVVKSLLLAALSEARVALSDEMSQIEEYVTKGFTPEWIEYAQTPEGAESIATGGDGSWTPGRVEPDEQDLIAKDFLSPMQRKLDQAPTRSTNALAVLLKSAMGRAAASSGVGFSWESEIERKQDMDPAFGQFIDTNELDDIKGKISVMLTYHLLSENLDDCYTVLTAGYKYDDIDWEVDYLLSKAITGIIKSLYDKALRAVMENPGIADEEIESVADQIGAVLDRVNLTHARGTNWSRENALKSLLQTKRLMGGA